MWHWKVILFLIAMYIAKEISYMPKLQVPDDRWELKQCKSIENGYEYNNFVYEKKGVKLGEPDVNCWYYCNFDNNCLIRLKQPRIYSYKVRIINAFIFFITMLIISF